MKRFQGHGPVRGLEDGNGFCMQSPGSVPATRTRWPDPAEPAGAGAVS